MVGPTAGRSFRTESKKVDKQTWTTLIKAVSGLRSRVKLLIPIDPPFGYQISAHQGMFLAVNGYKFHTRLEDLGTSFPSEVKDFVKLLAVTPT